MIYKLRINGCLGSFLRPVFEKQENTTYRKLNLFLSVGPLKEANLHHCTTYVSITTAI
jgi:hypothetical protein